MAGECHRLPCRRPLLATAHLLLWPSIAFESHRAPPPPAITRRQAGLTLVNFGVFGVYHQRTMPYHAHFQNRLESFLFACSALMIVLVTAYTFPTRPIFALEVVLTSVLVISVAAVGAAQCHDLVRTRWRRMVSCFVRWVLCRPVIERKRRRKRRRRSEQGWALGIDAWPTQAAADDAAASPIAPGSVRSWNSMHASEDNSEENWTRTSIRRPSKLVGGNLNVYVRSERSLRVASNPRFS